MPSKKLGEWLVRVREWYKERWNQKDSPQLARQLREYADALEKPQPGSKKKAKN